MGTEETGRGPRADIRVHLVNPEPGNETDRRAIAAWNTRASPAPDDGMGSSADADTQPGSADRWADLERLAEEAKPGPWDYTMGASGCPCIEDEHGRVVASYLSAEDAAYIAAANPSAVLELIAAARAVRGGYEGAEGDEVKPKLTNPAPATEGETL